MSDPNEIIERRLNEVLEEQTDSVGLHFFCQIGGNYNDLGLITLQISGVGNVLLSWSQSDDHDVLVSVQIGRQDLIKIHRLLLNYPFWATTMHRRPRRGEETHIHLRLSDQGAGTYNGVQFWSGDLVDVPVLQELMKRVLRIIVSLSDNAISFEDIRLFGLDI